MHDELGVLDAYLAIVSARFGERVAVELDVDQQAHPLAVPALLLQPLVENAVRHGTNVEYASAIQVRIVRVGAELHISVANEIAAGNGGDGVPGTGLGTTRDRLRLLYGDAHSFTAGAEGRRFIVRIVIPAHVAAPLPAEPSPAAYARAHS